MPNKTPSERALDAALIISAALGDHDFLWHRHQRERGFARFVVRTHSHPMAVELARVCVRELMAEGFGAVETGSPYQDGRWWVFTIAPHVGLEDGEKLEVRPGHGGGMAGHDDD